MFDLSEGMFDLSEGMFALGEGKSYQVRASET